MTDQVPKEVCAPVTRQECREVTSHGHHDVDARDVHAGNAGDGDDDDDDENLSLGENTKR